MPIIDMTIIIAFLFNEFFAIFVFLITNMKIVAVSVSS